MQQQQFKYFAFISYSSKDTEWGKKIQKKLENYRMPATLCSERGWERTPIKPVFFAPTDIQPGGLTEELQERLKASRNLIVICSPNSAKSEWVGKEIEFFHQLGRTKQIHFFIVDGAPYNNDPERECFNPIVNTLGLPEILGANIHEKIYRWPWMNKERAYVQLVSKLLGVEFDAIWQRHKRLLVQKIIAWIIAVFAIIAALTGVWMTNQPVDIELRLNEASIHNDNLPPLHDAVVTMTLDNETKKDTLQSLDDTILFANIPHHFLNNKVRIQVEAPDFLPVDTTVLLTKLQFINIFRNPNVYGNVHFMLWNPQREKGVANVMVMIDGHSVMSDAEGYVKFDIPLAEQKKAYPISATLPLLDDSLHLPCGSDDAIQIK